jgi:hypothetical protein
VRERAPSWGPFAWRLVVCDEVAIVLRIEADRLPDWTEAVFAVARLADETGVNQAEFQEALMTVRTALEDPRVEGFTTEVEGSTIMRIHRFTHREPTPVAGAFLRVFSAVAAAGYSFDAVSF